MMNWIETGLIIGNAFLFAGIVSAKGLPYTAAGLICEIAAMGWIARRSHRRPRAGALAIAAALGMTAGLMRRPAPGSPEGIAALILTMIVHGGILLMTAELLSP